LRTAEVYRLQGNSQAGFIFEDAFNVYFRHLWRETQLVEQDSAGDSVVIRSGFQWGGGLIFLGPMSVDLLSVEKIQSILSDERRFGVRQSSHSEAFSFQ
jgi:hypothetical protein